jgi:hypothetical protein
MTEDPTRRYVTKNGKSLHQKTCYVLDQKNLKLATAKQLQKFDSCGKCLKHEKKSKPKDTKEPALKRIPATTFANKWISTNHQKRIIILIADTEGKQYCSQFSVMSMDDFFSAHYNITIPKEYRHKQVLNSISIGEAFDRIEALLNRRVPEAHEVWFLFHNGKNHDFPLINALLPKNFRMPDHFRFADSIDLIRNVTSGFELKWSETFIYQTLFGETLEYRKTASQKPHVACYDVLQLRRIFRFLALWLYESRCFVSGLMEARSLLIPDGPCGDALEMFQSFTINHIEAKKMDTYGTAALKPLHSLNPSLANYARKTSTKAHIEKCPITIKYKLPIETDLKRLQSLPLCQMCPFPVPLFGPPDVATAAGPPDPTPIMAAPATQIQNHDLFNLANIPPLIIRPFIQHS